MDCIVQGVAKSQTRLSDFHFSSLSFQCDCCPYKKSRLGPRKHKQKDSHVKTQQEGVCKPRREASEEAKAACSLILHFQPPEVSEN